MYTSLKNPNTADLKQLDPQNTIIQKTIGYLEDNYSYTSRTQVARRTVLVEKMTSKKRIFFFAGVKQVGQLGKL